MKETTRIDSLLNEVFVRTHTAKTLLRFAMNRFVLPKDGDEKARAAREAILVPLLTAVFDEICSLHDMADWMLDDCEKERGERKETV